MPGGGTTSESIQPNSNFDMIRDAIGFEAHLEDAERGPRDHSTAGAIHAIQTRCDGAVPIAFAIAGHHAGLSDHADLVERLQKKGELLQRVLDRRPPSEILDGKPAALPPSLDKRRLEFWTRMLFSALCDADFLDTENFFDEGKAALRSPGPSIEELGDRLARSLEKKEREAHQSEVNIGTRRMTRPGRRCSSAGISLVPTGGGKTLRGDGIRWSMLASTD